MKFAKHLSLSLLALTTSAISLRISDETCEIRMKTVNHLTEQIPEFFALTNKYKSLEENCFKENICFYMKDDVDFFDFSCCLDESKTIHDKLEHCIQSYLTSCCDSSKNCCSGDTYPTN